MIQSFCVLLLLSSAVYALFRNHRDKHYIFFGFVAKIIFSAAFLYIYTQYYQRGDTFLYYDQAIRLSEIFKGDVSKLHFLIESGLQREETLAPMGLHRYLSLPDVFLTVKLVWLSSLFGSLNYISTTFVVSSISFLAIIYFYQYLRRKEYMDAFLGSFVCFGVPSFLFWTSGITKEAFYISAFLVIIVEIFKTINHGRLSIFNGILLTVSLYILLTIKAFIFLVFAFVAAIAFIYYLYWRRKKISFKKQLLFGLIFCLLLFLVPWKYDTFSIPREMIEFYNANSERTLNESIKSNVDYEGVDAWSLMSEIPSAMLTAYFEPYPWKIQKGIQALAFIEVLYLVGVSVYLFGFWYPKAFICFDFSSYIFIKALLFLSILLMLLYGLTTANIGTLVRYRALPYFLLIFVIVMIRKTRVNEV